MTKEEAVKLVEKLRSEGVDVESIENPHQMKWLLEHPDFERYPVCVEQFILGKKYLGATKCRRSVLKKMIEIFGEQSWVDEKPKQVMRYMDVIDMEGIGSGKTFSASIFITYGVYRLLCLKSPQEYYGKSPKTAIAFMLMSTSEKNAKDVIFTEINARILENKNGFFYNKYPPDSNITTQLNFAKILRVVPGNSSETFFVGYNIFMAIIDECDDHKKTKEKDYVEDGYAAIRQRILSRFPGYGGSMAIGSPKDVRGFMMRHYKEAQDDPSMLGIKLATWEAIDAEDFCGRKFIGTDPYGLTHEIPIEYQKDMEKNPDRFWRDMGAIPSISMEPFITLTQRIFEATNKQLVTWDGVGQFPLLRGSGKKEYIAHIDLGTNLNGADHCGIGVGHIVGSMQVEEFQTYRKVERPHIVMDLVCRLSAKQGGEIQIGEVRRLLLYLRDIGFGFFQIQFDSWQSKDSQQILGNMGFGIKQVSVDRDMYAYEAVKEALYEKRLEYGELLVPDEGNKNSTEKYDIICKELIELRRVKNTKIDHPVGGSKDVSDCIAGVVLGLTEAKVLHKIGTRYTPNFVRDNLNIENVNRQYEHKKLKTGPRPKLGTILPRVTGASDAW